MLITFHMLVLIFLLYYAAKADEVGLSFVFCIPAICGNLILFSCTVPYHNEKRHKNAHSTTTKFVFLMLSRISSAKFHADVSKFTAYGYNVILVKLCHYIKC